MAKEPIIYSVFFDNNGLRGKAWIQNGLVEKIKTIREEKMVQVTFYVPEIVKGEWCRNYKAEAKEHLRNIYRLHKQLGGMQLTSETGLEVTDDVVERTAEEYLKEHRIKVVKTPYDKIPIESLLQRAIQHVPPFKSTTDEGIKDAFIAHTIKNFSLEHPTHRIAIICNDKTLKPYIEELFMENATAKVHDSIVSFESSLRLELDELSETLSENARKLFYIPGDKDTLYYSNQIGENVIAQYNTLVPSGDVARERVLGLSADKVRSDYGLPNDENWSALDSKLSVSAPVFQKRVRHRLHWESTIVIKQAYALSSVAEEIALNNSSSIIHKMEFKVNWSSLRKDDNSIVSPTIGSISLVNESAEVDMYPGINYQLGRTKLTLEANDVKTASGQITTSDPMKSALASVHAIQNAGYLGAVKNAQDIFSKSDFARIIEMQKLASSSGFIAAVDSIRKAQEQTAQLFKTPPIKWPLDKGSVSSDSSDNDDNDKKDDPDEDAAAAVLKK